MADRGSAAAVIEVEPAMLEDNRCVHLQHPSQKTFSPQLVLHDVQA